jgi:hypothetical protein
LERFAARLKAFTFPKNLYGGPGERRNCGAHNIAAL